MVKTEMNIKDTLRKPHYKSIFELTREFQKKENGLQQKHYRYALVKDVVIEDENKKKRERSSFYLDKFFSDSNGNDLLEVLYKSGKIQKECIIGDNLKNFLKLMVDKGILEITNPDETVKKYKIPINVINVVSKERIIERINRYPIDRIIHTAHIIDYSALNLSEEKAINGLLFGFPNGFYNKYLPEKDIEIVKRNILNIHKSCIEINGVLCKYALGGIGKISLLIESTIQPQLIEDFKTVDEEVKKLFMKKIG